LCRLNMQGFYPLLGAFAAGSMLGGAIVAALPAGGVALPSLTTAGTAAGAAAASPTGQQIIVNIGGEFEGPANAIILQTGQIGGSTQLALQNASQIASATGQQVVVGMGNSIPLATGSVDEVIVNSVPIGTASGYFGPNIDPGEITRILAAGGTVGGSSAQEYFDALAVDE
jgi:hypothetical protein